jgi:hypothetical protein
VVSHRSGWGRTVLNSEAVVYDSGNQNASFTYPASRLSVGSSRCKYLVRGDFLTAACGARLTQARDCVTAGDRWHINGSRQLEWAISHCLCPGCNGTHPGECEECVPRSPGCDVLAPEYDCWMDVRTRSSGWPLYDTGVRCPSPKP